MRYQKEFVITEGGKMNLPVILRERHFSEGVEPSIALVQPIGRCLRITVWSPRDSVEVDLPLTEWWADRPLARSLSGDRVNMSRWMDFIEYHDEDSRVVYGDVRTIDPEWKPADPRSV